MGSWTLVIFMPALPTCLARDVAASGPTDVVAVGDSARVLRETGTGFAVETVPVTANLLAVDVAAPDLAVAVGAGGMVLRWSGAQNRLFLNNGAGVFADFTVARLPADADLSADLALADADLDGDLDVIATDDATPPSTTYHVYAFRGTGALMWKTVPKNFFGSTLSAGHPVVADVLGNGEPEVLVSTNTEICVLSRSGVQLTDNGAHAAGSFSFYTDTTVSNGTLSRTGPPKSR